MRGGRDVVLWASVATKWTQRSRKRLSAILRAVLPICPRMEPAVTWMRTPPRDPVDEAIGVGLEGGIALRVGQDGGKAGDLQLIEGLGEPLRKAVVGDLDQEVAEAVDAVARGIGFGGEDVVVGEMEVGATAERQVDVMGLQQPAELGDLCGDHRGLELIVGVGGAVCRRCA